MKALLKKGRKWAAIGLLEKTGVGPGGPFHKKYLVTRFILQVGLSKEFVHKEEVEEYADPAKEFLENRLAHWISGKPKSRWEILIEEHQVTLLGWLGFDPWHDITPLEM